MTPERLAQHRHHHERHAHFTQEMVGELLHLVDAQAETIAKLRGALIAVHTYEGDYGLLCWGMAPCCLGDPREGSKACEQARHAVARASE